MSKDLAASVRARLLNIAKAEGTDFNQILVRYALERILYRLSQSAHADRFLLKGALCRVAFLLVASKLVLNLRPARTEPCKGNSTGLAAAPSPGKPRQTCLSSLLVISQYP